jgi:CheY-like chemotaxis protein
MRRVLVLEDDEMQRDATVRALSKLEDVDIVAANTVAEATELFRSAPPLVIVSDLDLPDGSGLQLLGEVARAGGGIPVIFVSAYLAELNEWIPRRPDVDLLAKPVDLGDLRSLVADRLVTYVPKDRPFTVDDYIQLACMGRQAILIKLEDSDRLIGEIYVRSGEVWSAIDTHGEGFEALERLRSSMASVAFETQWADKLERNVAAEVIIEEPIETPVAPLEWKAPEPDSTKEPAPMPEPALEPTCASEAIDPDSLDALLDRGVDAVLRRDFHAALEAYERAQAIEPENPVIRGNVERLRKLVR